MIHRAVKISAYQKIFALLLCLSSITLLLHIAPAHAFSLDDVTAKAKILVEKPYVAPVSNLPKVFSQMQFADYQQIQPLPGKFEWR